MTPKTDLPKSVEYLTVPIGQIEPEAVNPSELDPAQKRVLLSSGGAMAVHGSKMVKKVIIHGRGFTPTNRFWTSLYARFGLNNAFFKFFDHSEVFKRIAEKEHGSAAKVRVAIEHPKSGADLRLLAATGLNKPVVVYDDLLDILKAFKTDKGGIRYDNGVVTSSHTPRVGQNKFEIGADDFSNKFELHCPVDGYGQPNVFLSLLRWICSNGAVGFANAFKTSLVLGSGYDSTNFALRRALDSFTNDEGYAMMRDRFEMATRSWASINEQQSLYRVLPTLQDDAALKNTIGDWNRIYPSELQTSVAAGLLKAYDRATGDPYDMYKADPNLMSEKRKRTLPVQCKVYDMINFVTELATHYVSEPAARQLQAWVGNMISTDYDLEGSANEFDDWRDVFMAEMAAKQAEKAKKEPVLA